MSNQHGHSHQARAKSRTLIGAAAGDSCGDIQRQRHPARSRARSPTRPRCELAAPSRVPRLGQGGRPLLRSIAAHARRCRAARASWSPSSRARGEPTAIGSWSCLPSSRSRRAGRHRAALGASRPHRVIELPAIERSPSSSLGASRPPSGLRAACDRADRRRAGRDRADPIESSHCLTWSRSPSSWLGPSRPPAGHCTACHRACLC